MVRKKFAPEDQRLVGVDSGHLQGLVDGWLQKIRGNLPEGGTAVVTVHQASRKRFLVSFRASAYGETFISEVRRERLDDAVNEAGKSLVERLSQSPLQPKKENLGEKVRRLLGDIDGKQREAG